MFDWLYLALGTMLSWFSSLFGGKYAFALLLYALLFKLLFLPFGIKQQKNQIKMAHLTPKIELIRAKYRGRNDQPTMQKMQQEIMELQQKEGYSPLSGCLPLLLQLPIIIFLYNVIRGPLSYICQVSADGIAKIREILGETAKNLDEIGLISAIEKATVAQKESINEIVKIDTIPDFTLFGVNLADTPSFASFSILLLIPVLAAAFTWLSMWLVRKWNNTGLNSQQDAQAQASMRIMDLIMPLMTLWMAFSFSGMLGLYWIYQSILGILQSFILAKVMPLPKYTEEELKAMRKAQKAAEKAQKAALKEQPRYRSLHYIDDDDYDELPSVTKQNDDQTKKTQSGIDIPDIKD